MFPPAEAHPGTEPPLEAATVSSEPKAPEVPVISTGAYPATPSVTKPLESATPTEPPAGQELHIPAGHTAVHHKPRVWVWVLITVIVLIWIYAAVDALTEVKLPYEFFQNLSQD